MEIKKIGYVVNNKCDSDNSVALEFCCLFPIATSKNIAWKYFLSIAGKDREYWNKKGYIAEKVEYTLKIK